VALSAAPQQDKEASCGLTPPACRGWKAARIDTVLGGNFVRLFGEVWG
jgi:hypothetical protein